jgi:hypothetical protein
VTCAAVNDRRAEELRMSLRYVGAEELDRRYPAISTGGG